MVGESKLEGDVYESLYLDALSRLSLSTFDDHQMIVSSRLTKTFHGIMAIVRNRAAESLNRWVRGFAGGRLYGSYIEISPSDSSESAAPRARTHNRLVARGSIKIS